MTIKGLMQQHSVLVPRLLAIPQAQEWTAMKPQYFLMQGVELVAVGEATLSEAQKRVTGCAACSASASRSFEWLINHVLDGNGMTEYVLCSPAECPRCASPLFERTLVNFDGNAQDAVDESEAFVVREEDQDVVFIDEPTLLDAQSFIVACEHCCDEAEMPFDQLLDAITGCDPTTTEYVICHTAKCSACLHDVMEKTLIVPA